MVRPAADEGEVIATFAEIRERLVRIEDQTSKTNGRVRALEQFKAAAVGVGAFIILEIGWMLMLLRSHS